MEKYKPGYMGKVMPVDDKSKMTDFVVNKYDSFSKVYDACKDKSDAISDIRSIDTGSSSNETMLSVKVTAAPGTVQEISDKNTDPNVSVQGDIITATGDKNKECK